MLEVLGRGREDGRGAAEETMSDEKIVASDDWCTPRDLAVLLGPFELDPCSNDRSYVIAANRYDGTPGNDGLVASWTGSVFVNPPYSNPLPWCERLRDHKGPWVALMKLDPSTKWWATLMQASPTVAPFRKRLKFERPDKPPLTANFPSVLLWSRWRPCAELARLLWLPTYPVIEVPRRERDCVHAAESAAKVGA